MTLQEIYDKAVGGVLKQGCRSVDEGASCVLRDENGSACAIGHLLKDEDYNSGLEMEAWMDGAENAQEFAKRDLGKILEKNIGPIGDREFEMMNRLQIAHDEGYEFEDVVDGFKQVAADFKLDRKVIEDWKAGQAA